MVSIFRSTDLRAIGALQALSLLRADSVERISKDVIFQGVAYVRRTVRYVFDAVDISEIDKLILTGLGKTMTYLHYLKCSLSIAVN